LGNVTYAAQKEDGYRVVQAVDVCPIVQATYERNFPNGLMHKADVENMTKKDLVDHDVAFWGVPCQAFSTMGHLNPGDQKRSLVHQVPRMTRGWRPGYVVIENVPGIQTALGGSVWEQFVKAMRGEGYYLHWSQELLAAELGPPQGRRRFFAIFVQGKARTAVALRKPRRVGRKRSLSTFLGVQVQREIAKTVRCGGYGTSPLDFAHNWTHYLKTGKSGVARHHFYELTQGDTLRLQGRNMRTKLPDQQRAARTLIGNAIPVQMVRAVIRAIADHSKWSSAPN
jgi:site-specific DNA-cytosine methylase